MNKYEKLGRVIAPEIGYVLNLVEANKNAIHQTNNDPGVWREASGSGYDIWVKREKEISSFIKKLKPLKEEVK